MLKGLVNQFQLREADSSFAAVGYARNSESENAALSRSAASEFGKY